MPLFAIIDQLMYRISLRTLILGDTWIKNYLKDYSSFHLSGSSFSNRIIQVKDS